LWSIALNSGVRGQVDDVRPVGKHPTMRRLASAALILWCCAIGCGVSAAARSTPLRLTISGHGSVSVYGHGSLACKAACEATFRPSTGVIVINAHPGAGFHFTRWTGACHGTRLVCFLRSGVSATVNAFFAPPAWPGPR
jgi:hypothetical protein